jgi:nitrogen regulatory protein P-II 1
MKLITAIVRPEKLDELIGALIANRAHGLTVTEARGFGRQYGQIADAGPDEDLGLADDRTAALLPKVRLDVVVPDEDADRIADIIAKHAHTDAIGDGKIWVTTVDSAIRVRTGERDLAAL